MKWTEQALFLVLSKHRGHHATPKVPGKPRLSPNEKLLLSHPTVELPSFLIQSQPQLP